MKHSLSRLLALVVTLSISMGSSATLFTGNDLQPYCADQDDTFMFAQCLAYIRGVDDGYLIGLSKQVKLYCIPDNVTLGQTAKIVSKFLEENPEHLHQPAQSLVYAALYIAFPCEDGQ